MTTRPGQRINIMLPNGRQAEARVDAVLPNGYLRVITADVYDIDGHPTNVFVVESYVAYRLLRAA